ncbi:peroxidase 12-like [Typha angustifolia]|uniref:peroxidase 12-like n=1 Tax=Typha angustifolia TaxID=59011 RepID=UPI003C2B9AF7
MAYSTSTKSLLILLASSLAILSSATNGECYKYPPIVNGLSFSFYQKACPKLESIVRNFLKKTFKNDIGVAAGLLRLHFHDCFVQGCDGSVLLDGSASGPGEQQSIPNLTLRPSAFKAINDLRDLIAKSCGQLVSCSDILALAARDSVYLSGGPDYKVPLGRRDGQTFATNAATLAALPPPFANVTTMLDILGRINLDAADLVALSGGHTIGIAHCSSFTDRLYPQDPIMNKFFANLLKQICPAKDTPNSTNNDIRTPNTFDNKYYVDLLNRQGLFTSDQDLYTDSRTKPMVKSFALDQSLFFEKFVYSMVKMGQLSVLTGSSGEIRTNCSARNSGGSNLWSIVEGEGESQAY